MSLKKTLSVVLCLCMLLSVFAAMPSLRAQAMSTDIVVIRADSAQVLSEADPSAELSAYAPRDNTFLLLDTKTGTDGKLWYKIHYSSSITGWVSAADAATAYASSTVYDPYTKYLKRVAQVTVERFDLRAKPGANQSVVATASKNDHMVVLGYDNDGAGTTWYEVRYGNTNCWISRKAAVVTNLCSAPEKVDPSRETPVIYLSPSRQPANPYAAGGTNEWEQMTRVADALKIILESRYDCVVHMAEFETPITKFNRPLEARNLGADIYLAIHSNATGGSSTAYGTQAYYFPGSEQNRLMAENLVRRISSVAPFPDTSEGAINGMTYLSGVGYGEVRDPGGFGMISALLEVEFHDNADSAQWIIDNPQTIANAIANGLDDTFHFLPKGGDSDSGATPSEPTTTTTTASFEDGMDLGKPTSAATTTTTVTTTTTTSTTTATTSATVTTATTTAATTSATVPTESTTAPTEGTTEPTESTTAPTEETTTPTESTTAPTDSTTAPTTTTTTAPSVSSQPQRADGSDRIDTAAKISAMGWDSAHTVIVASGSSYPDALAGVPLSKAADAPILLTTGKDSAEKALLDEIARLGAKKAYILGGDSAVPSGVESDLTAAGLDCVRLAGSDRYETCVIIATELARLTDAVFDTVYFASAENFPDALAISPVAAIEGNPIMYIAAKSGVNGTIAQYVSDTGCKQAVLLGGESAVSAVGKDSLEALGLSVERISGADRYATGLAIVQRFENVFKGSGVALATGKNFPDALAGGGHAAKLGVPVLLVGDKAGSDLLGFVSARDTGDVYIYGGTGAVSEAVAQEVTAAVQ